MTAPSHILRAHNLKVGHIFGVMPLPVSTTGNPEEDRETMTDAIVTCVRRVLPQAGAPQVRWSPSGTQAFVSVTVPLEHHRTGTRQMRVAVFHVQEVKR